MTEIIIPKDIKNIVFDLGGVILNIDYHKTAQAFNNLGCENFDEIYSQKQQKGLFDRFEIGQISSQEFIKELLKALPVGVRPKEVVDAWNAMLLNLPQERIESLQGLNQTHRVFLLSNTNQIHEEAFTKIIQQENGIASFNHLFEKVYFSHQIGLRKPNREVFDYVLRENGLKPTETLFIDDSPQHLLGAEKAGIRTLLYN